MSRRKQAKPQQLRSELGLTALTDNAVSITGVDDADSGNESRSGSEEAHTCEKCCAEFFKWSDLCEHLVSCIKIPQVFIMNSEETLHTSQEYSNEDSSVSNCPSDLADMDDLEGGQMTTEGDVNGEGSEKTLVDQEDEAMEIEQSKKTSGPAASSPQLNCSPAIMTYLLPNTNVTLETLHSTRVAVAQFSQSFHSGHSYRGTTVAIPMILEQLVALQQQQIHQLQLIEQIRGQMATISRHSVQLAINTSTVSQSSSSIPTSTHLQGFIVPPVHPLPALMSSSVTRQPSITSAVEKPQVPNSQLSCGQSKAQTDAGTTDSSSSGITVSSTIGISSITETSNSYPHSLNSSLLSPSSVGLQPHAPTSGVIFPNPLASIAATTIALDPLSALEKHRKGKPQNFSVFDTKSSSEDPFFKHKCRFCAKVFGSDSALQIHLRSHTGERPFKCNICGNRFSTKGNLKVHFQRHKEKYPHIQMNPYPVPEYLDNVPTKSGIPYGMSIPPEKSTMTWFDGKPIAPSSEGQQVPPTLSSISSNDFPNFTTLSRSPQRPSPTTSKSLVSPSHDASSRNDLHNEMKVDVKSLTYTRRDNHIFPPSSGTTEVSGDSISSLSINTHPTTIDQHKTKFSFGGLMDSSETSKLQQLVENIDKKVTDPNKCVICHRVLSCQSALKMHYRIHTGERPFKCKVCGRAFTTKGNLKTHIGVHRAKPPLRVQHSCPICQKKFTNAVVLQQHIRMHMGGQIPDMPLLDEFQDVDGEQSFDNTSIYEDELLDENSIDEDAECHVPSSATSLSSSSASLTSSVAALENLLKWGDSVSKMNQSSVCKSVERDKIDHEHLKTDGTSALGDMERLSGGSPAISEACSSIGTISPTQSPLDSQHSNSPGVNDTEELHEITATIKCEKSESLSFALESGALNLTAVQISKSVIKEESPFDLQLLSRDQGVKETPIVFNSESTTEREIDGLGKNISAGLHLPFGTQAPQIRGGITSLLAAPPLRRTTKQHNCHSCGKNFSSASALQIHERTHTGEKPFSCSVCGRAFTTKGNLKVHMGTHMWNNAPARRGRRLSVDTPVTLLGSDALKLGDIIHKDLAMRAMNADPRFWNQYATAIGNGLGLKNNEISVIQNGSMSQLPALPALGSGGGNSLTLSFGKASGKAFY